MNETVKRFCTRLGVAHPIIQAPMAGGATTPELVAAVSNEGGLGSIGAAYLTPPALRDAIAAVRARTDKPFGVNLFAGGYEEAGRAVDPAPMLAVVARHHAALGLPEPEPPALTPDPFPAQLEAVIEARVPVFSVTFGMPKAGDTERLKAQGTLVFGTATTVEEARRLAGAGVDGAIAQGAEAGAHRGTFAAPFEIAMTGTLALVPQFVDAVPDLPVIAAGGIMDGRGIVAAEALGAAAVQMGTAFLTSDEAGIPDRLQGFADAHIRGCDQTDPRLLGPPCARRRQRFYARRRGNRRNPALPAPERPHAADAPRGRQGGRHRAAVALGGAGRRDGPAASRGRPRPPPRCRGGVGPGCLDAGLLEAEDERSFIADERLPMVMVATKIVRRCLPPDADAETVTVAMV